jgi:hypothetical protein
MFQEISQFQAPDKPHPGYMRGINPTVYPAVYWGLRIIYLEHRPDVGIPMQLHGDFKSRGSFSLKIHGEYVIVIDPDISDCRRGTFLFRIRPMNGKGEEVVMRNSWISVLICLGILFFHCWSGFGGWDVIPEIPPPCPPISVHPRGPMTQLVIRYHHVTVTIKGSTGNYPRGPGFL